MNRNIKKVTRTLPKTARSEPTDASAHEAVTTNPTLPRFVLGLLDEFPCPVWRSGTDGKCDYFNQAWLDFTGRSIQQELGDGWAEGVHPDDLDFCLSTYLAAFHARLAFEMEYRLRNQQGEYRWIDDCGKPFYDLEGNFCGYVGTCFDTTERKRVEQSLREYEKAVEGLDEMMVVVDRDYCYVVANRAFLKYRGLEGEQLVGRQISDTLNPGVFENIVKAKLDECFGGQIVKYEMRYDYPTLGERDLSISYFPIEGPRGVDRVACILQDITEANRAEEALRSSETKFRRLLDSSIVGVVFWDLHGNLLSANDLFLNMIGYSRLDLEQGRLSWKDITPPEYTAVDEQAISELLATGNCTPFEKEYIRKDGSRVAVMIGSAILEGQKDKGSSFIMDISERKLVEEELRQSEERFRQLAESITEVFWMTNPEKGEILYVSPAYEKIWGRSRESVYQNPTDWLEAIFPADRQRIKTAARTLQVSGSYDEEYRIIKPDGSVRWIRDRAFPIKDSEGRVYRVTGIAEDITEHKLAEEKIKATSTQLRALSAHLQSAREEEGRRIARELHDELGGALTSLKWDLEGLVKAISDSRDPSRLPALREKIAGMVNLSETTISAVRRISSELRPSILDDLGLVEAIKWQAKESETRTGIAVHYDRLGDEPPLNPQQTTAVFRILQEVLTNILRHAQATKVRIQMKQEESELILTIADNGRGMTEDEAEGIHSLGLLGMRERAHLIGGTLCFAGSAGFGTVITLRIPVRRLKSPSEHLE